MPKKEIAISDELLALVGANSRLVCITVDTEADENALMDILENRQLNDAILVLPKEVINGT